MILLSIAVPHLGKVACYCRPNPDAITMIHPFDYCLIISYIRYMLSLVCTQRVEDPDTQAGFFQTCHGNRTWHVLALPRDPQGRRLKRIKDRHGRLKKAKASYYRLVRPHTGFGVGDMGAEGGGFPCVLVCWKSLRR